MLNQCFSEGSFRAAGLASFGAGECLLKCRCPGPGSHLLDGNFCGGGPGILVLEACGFLCSVKLENPLS